MTAAGLLSVQQQDEDEEVEEEAERCQIVCMDVYTIEMERDQQWDFAAAQQEEHPFLGVVDYVSFTYCRNAVTVTH